MDWVEFKSDNGTSIIVNPANVCGVQRVRNPDQCRVYVGEMMPFDVAMSPEEACKSLGVNVVPATALKSLAATKESAGPARKTVKAGVKKGKIKTGTVAVSGKSAMSAS